MRTWETPAVFQNKPHIYPIWSKDLSILQCKKIERLGEEETSCIHPQQAVIYFRELLKDGTANVFHLGSVIRTMDDPWEAQRLIREAEESGLEPTTAVYNTLINSYVMNVRSKSQNSTWCSSAKRENFNSFHIFITLQEYHLHCSLMPQRHPSKSNVESKRDCDVNSNTGTKRNEGTPTRNRRGHEQRDEFRVEKCRCSMFGTYETIEKTR